MNISKSRQRRRQRHRPCVCVCASEWKQSEIGIVWLAILSLLLLLPPPSPYTINLSSFKSPRLAERKTFSKSVGRRKFPYASQHSRWGVDGGWIEKRKQADQEPLKKRKIRRRKWKIKNGEPECRIEFQCWVDWSTFFSLGPLHSARSDVGKVLAVEIDPTRCFRINLDAIRTSQKKDVEENRTSRGREKRSEG